MASQWNTAGERKRDWDLGNLILNLTSLLFCFGSLVIVFSEIPSLMEYEPPPWTSQPLS